ncbi:Formamidase [Suillus subaureus]|uniref:Formamidase n=1 Tax=Suillus subaureus TaxID=48587 RepID=A0A9P7EL35_9AGAM|nr:Formamidase [Suillus subaureus]KAG1824901.1 Formamidase [Suillus subaureus]
MSIHSVRRECANLAWDNSIPPALHVKSGDEITFDCIDASNGQLTAESTVATLATINMAAFNPVNGPVFVDGAQPGDTLQVDVLHIKNPEWGWTGLFPGFGLLADESWKLEQEGFAWFDEKKGIKVPLRPFAGEMGVAQKKNGALSTIPPYHTGGNIDTKHITVGSTLFLPVEVAGALFSIGDGHAAQGDGGSAIETPMRVTVRLSVRKDKPYTKTPHFSTATTDAGEYYCTTGIDSDMREATRSAVRNMIAFLVAEYGLDRVDAYILCSVAGDLRMHEVVDMPNYVIGIMMPRSVLRPSNNA